MITKRGVDSFPFDHEDFEGESFAYLQKGQLQSPLEKTNQIPLLYLLNTLPLQQSVKLSQFGIAKYIGLMESNMEDSFLNPNQSSFELMKKWHIKEFKKVKDLNVDSLNPDTLTIYQLALLYSDLLQTGDLETFHHYADKEKEAESDDLLTLPAKTSPIKFLEIIGHPYYLGIRNISPEISLCWQNESSVAISDELVTEYFTYISVKNSESLIAQLGQGNALLKSKMFLDNQNCSLIIAPRNKDQFPFNTYTFNGMYSHEGTISSKGEPCPLPIIYLNVDNLALNSNTKNNQKSLSLVLAHEFAHFLGFRHSQSSESLIAPAGTHEKLDMKGYDEKMISSWAESFTEEFDKN